MNQPKQTPQGYPIRRSLELVEGERNQDYGAPHEDFGRTVGQLNALGYRGPGGRLLVPRDWALMQNAAKVSRLMNTPGHLDSVTDIAGYAGCYWECVDAEQKGRGDDEPV